MFAKLGAETRDEQAYETDALFLGKVDVAKQWQVSGDWGLGVGASIFAGRGWGTDSEDQDLRAGVGGATVNMVATYF
jgi:hypothetical protein